VLRGYHCDRFVATKNDITLLLRRLDHGEDGALEELMRVVYSDLERMAASQLRRQFGERVNQITMEPAALVNEAFLKLIKQRKGFDNRGQFFAIATKLMLRVLTEYRRKKFAVKRRGSPAGVPRMTLALDLRRDDALPANQVDIEELVQVLESLDRLDPRRAEIVKMRVVWSMTVPEVAELLDVSASSVDRDWRWAKAWMADELGLISD
jgi:RNA polymerase sigma factor (TIGR02999 family)